MRSTRTKSTAKTFAIGTDIAELACFILDNTERMPQTVDAIPQSITKHKYVITVTRIFENCDVCGAKFEGTYRGPICPKCNGKNN